MRKFFITYYYKDDLGKMSFSNTVLKLEDSFNLEKLIPEMQEYIKEQNEYSEVTIINYLIMSDNRVQQ